jgi:hypothetical protein
VENSTERDTKLIKTTKNTKGDFTAPKPLPFPSSSNAHLLQPLKTALFTLT